MHQKQEIERLEPIYTRRMCIVFFLSLATAEKAEERADVVKLIPKVEIDRKEMTRISSIVEDESTEREQNPIVKEKIEDA